MYDLTQRITAGSATPYDAVKGVERYLKRNYPYSERVPTRPLPLNGFLFEDRRGYCQQFSGTMALMLRMAGIPARVATGFSPGSFNRDSGEYRVRDLDAHSWVEVWFTGIGWVPFDPTPAASPAESQSTAAAASAAGTGAGDIRRGREGVAAERGQAGATTTSEDGGGWLLPALITLVLALPAAAAFVAGAACAPATRARARRAGRRSALRASPHAPATRLGPAHRHHPAGPGASSRPLRRPRLAGLRAAPSAPRASIRASRPDRGSATAARCAASSAAGASATGCSRCWRCRPSARAADLLLRSKVASPHWTA